MSESKLKPQLPDGNNKAIPIEHENATNTERRP